MPYFAELKPQLSTQTMSTPLTLYRRGSWGGAVVRALASHQCVPGSIPGPGVICELSLLLVLALLRGFFSGFSGFPPSSKTNISKFQFDREFEGHGFVSRRLLCATLVKQSQFIIFFFFLR